MESHFSTYASLFDHCPQNILPDAVKELSARAGLYPQAWMTLSDVAEKYLNGPLSPVYNESHYLVFLDCFLHSKLPSKAQKSKYRFQKKTLTMNAPGRRAANFTYPDEDGKTRHMHQVKSDTLLLIFYDPICTHCIETLKEIDTDNIIQQAVDEGRMKTLLVDVNDVELEGLYFINSLPSLYLLDGKKRVILKDTSVEKLRMALSSNI